MNTINQYIIQKPNGRPIIEKLISLTLRFTNNYLLRRSRNILRDFAKPRVSY